jgi:hypothetical protein
MQQSYYTQPTGNASRQALLAAIIQALTGAPNGGQPMQHIQAQPRNPVPQPSRPLPQPVRPATIPQGMHVEGDWGTPHSVPSHANNPLYELFQSLRPQVGPKTPAQQYNFPQPPKPPRYLPYMPESESPAMGWKPAPQYHAVGAWGSFPAKPRLQ